MIPNNVAFAITTGSGITTNTNIKLAKTLNDAINGTPIPINEKGGELTVVSRVSDKNSGDIGHPIQFDTVNSQWYINVSTDPTENTIYSTIVGLGTTSLGSATPRTFIKRRTDSRSSLDKTYRMRYVIPAGSGVNARPPVEGFIIQESGTTIAPNNAEIQTYFGTGSLNNLNEQRNFRFIAGASWSLGVATIDTELPHNLDPGCFVEINNVLSANNTSGAMNAGFNGQYEVTSVTSAKQFTVSISADPGAFSNDINNRNTSLPYFKRKRYHNTYYVYRLSEAQKYISGEQDGIYYLNVLNASVQPTVAPFTADKYSQPVKELFPQISRDNVVSDPEPSECFAASNLIGLVNVNDSRKSITRETLNKMVGDSNIGVGITDIYSASGIGHTIHTAYDHGLNRIAKVQRTNNGDGYSDGTYYNVKLIAATGGTTSGSHATAKVVVTSNQISDVTIMDGGSAYTVGDDLTFDGITLSGGNYTEATVEVSNLYNNVGDVVRITGVSSESYSAYNSLYRITGINNTKSITVSSASSISSDVRVNNDFGIGANNATKAYVSLTGESISIFSLVYDHTSGIATVTSNSKHGLNVDRSVTITGADQSQYNGSFVVTKINSVTSFEVQLPVGTSSPIATGTMFALPEGFASNSGNITIENENLNGRMVPTYAGITTTLSSTISNASTSNVNIQDVGNLDLKIGDYLMVNSELMRIKDTPTGSNPIKVFRGILGTKATTHNIDSTITRVKVNPIELRRHSIIRASGHTFEYVGFGPGNYSTAFPDKHDRAISVDEELVAQSVKREGGINFYTGMNDRGISYSGNKRLSTITGREEIFDTPVDSVEGEDVKTVPNLNVTTPVEVVASRSITVEGGPDNKVISKFNGPLIVNNKLTVNSPKGLEANNIFIQGDATVSRKYTVGIATPSLSGNPGDVVYNANPSEAGYVGWIYTVDNAWRRFAKL